VRHFDFQRNLADATGDFFPGGVVKTLFRHGNIGVLDHHVAPDLGVDEGFANASLRGVEIDDLSVGVTTQRCFVATSNLRDPLLRRSTTAVYTLDAPNSRPTPILSIEGASNRAPLNAVPGARR